MQLDSQLLLDALRSERQKIVEYQGSLEDHHGVECEAAMRLQPEIAACNVLIRCLEKVTASQGSNPPVR